MKFHASSYLGQVFKTPDEYQGLIEQASKDIQKLKRKLKFDAIAFRGMSGAAVAFPVASQLGVPLICVRKRGDGSHGYGIEGTESVDVTRFLVVDDFIETGTTVSAIIDSIRERTEQEIERLPKFQVIIPECVGVYLYGHWATSDKFTHRHSNGTRTDFVVYLLGKIKH